jgi:UDP-N-acetylglucosamine 2-epimerase (non-hydrolysing)
MYNGSTAMKKKVLRVVGTRPEAIKMAPVYMALKQSDGITVETLNSGQHGNLIQQVFDVFDWEPEHTLFLKRESTDLADLYALLLTRLNQAFKAIKPDIVIVHGDTATTTAASMAAFFNRIKVAHVEAGLRSFNRMEPWPEEINRKIVDTITEIYFAPTQAAKENLLREGVSPDDIYTTGNTVVDALLWMSQRIDTHATLAKQLEKTFHFLDKNKKLVLVTGHRRENSGQNIRNVFSALLRIANEFDCQIAFPAHPNHDTQDEIRTSLAHMPNVHILPPLEYPEFVYLMRRSDVIISDSGGVQEEAPTFNKKVLVTRNVTERPEGIASGFLEIIGCDEDRIVSRVKSLLAASGKPAHTPNPYGDGKAAERIRDVVIKALANHENVIEFREASRVTAAA